MRDNQNSKYADLVFIFLLIIGFTFIIARSTPPIRLIKNFIYYISYPNINAANQIFQSAGNFADNIKAIVYLRQENLSYKQKNQELADQLRNYDTMCEQYTSLVKLLDIPKMRGKKSVFAKISIREPNEWYQWFVIDKGANEGLYNDLPVAMRRENGELCAVGRIIETYPGSSKVALITNVMSAVPVQIKGKNINCLAEGFNSNLMKITYIPLNAAVSAGDEIVSSSLSSVFGEGMPVGIISSVSQEPSMDFKTAIAEILFETDALYEAIILVPQEDEK